MMHCTEPANQLDFIGAESYHWSRRGCFCKGNSKSSTAETKNTDTKTNTDQSTGDVDQSSGGHAVGTRLSNVVDSEIHMSIQQHGLSGDDLAVLLEPAADALETISRDNAAAKSATAALATSASDIVDSAGDALEKGFAAAKEAAPVALAIAGGLYLMRRKKRKGKK